VGCEEGLEDAHAAVPGVHLGHNLQGGWTVLQADSALDEEYLALGLQVPCPREDYLVAVPHPGTALCLLFQFCRCHPSLVLVFSSVSTPGGRQSSRALQRVKREVSCAERKGGHACMQAVLMVDRMISPFTLCAGPVLFMLALLFVSDIVIWTDYIVAAAIYFLWVLFSRTVRMLPHFWRVPGPPCPPCACVNMMKPCVP
jgi:hypothetical protein